MNWIDYREKLGIGFSDMNKANLLSNKVATFIGNGKTNENYSVDDYYRFCLMTGINFSHPYPATSYIAALFTKNNLSIPKIISYYVAFVNTQTSCEESHRKTLFEILGEFLDDLNIPFEIIWDDDGGFVFPKGAKELDDALVSQTLEWLSSYPKARTAWRKALKDYAEQTDENASDIADKFRKALETFFQEFFGGSRSLEKYVTDHTYETYLDKFEVTKELRDELKNTVSSYSKYINNNAKHQDKTTKNVLEYLMYQTGNIMRLLITLKQEEIENAD